MNDKVQRSRQSIGSELGHTKLTSDNVYTIRRLYGLLPVEKLAGMFRIERSHVWSIVSRRWWKHLPEETHAT
jgi:hypothetical protein